MLAPTPQQWLSDAAVEGEAVKFMILFGEHPSSTHCVTQDE